MKLSQNYFQRPKVIQNPSSYSTSIMFLTFFSQLFVSCLLIFSMIYFSICIVEKENELVIGSKPFFLSLPVEKEIIKQGMR